MPTPDEERAFRTEFAGRFLSHRRAALLVALVLWCLFSALDLYFYRSLRPAFSRRVLAEIMLIRGAGATGLGLVAAISWGRSFLDEGHATAWLTGIAGLIAALLMVITAITPTASGTEYHYFGVILLLLFTSCFLHIRAKPASILASLIAVAMTAWELAFHTLGMHFLPAMGFYLSFFLTGNSIAARLERSARDRFLTVGRLERVNASLLAANRALTNGYRRDGPAAPRTERLIALLKDKVEERERFLRATYHDIMQPVSAIASFCLVAKGQLGRNGEAALPAVLGDIERSAKEIECLLGELRELYTCGSLVPVPEPVSLAAVLDDCARRFAAPARAKGLDFRVRAGRGGDTRVMTDPALLRRILANLISNAIKYTWRGGVLVGCMIRTDHVRIDVRDTGDGIPLHFQDRIFEEFFRIDDPGRPASNGLGLGLAIVRQLVRRLDGHRLTFASRPGRGSRFSIILPLPPRSHSRRTTAEAGDLDSAYIVIADPDTRRTARLASALSSSGSLVRIAGDLAALQALFDDAPDRSPDAVITGLTETGGPDPGDVIALVGHRFDWAAVPIVVLTGGRPPPDGLDCGGLIFTVNDQASPAEMEACLAMAVQAGRSAALPEEDPFLEVARDAAD